MFYVSFDKAYNQEYYNMLFYVGHTLYVLFVFITNYMRLNYYKKDSFNWLNVVTMILLIMVLIFGNSIIFLVLILGLVALLTIYWEIRCYGV